MYASTLYPPREAEALANRYFGIFQNGHKSEEVGLLATRHGALSGFVAALRTYRLGHMALIGYDRAWVEANRIAGEHYKATGVGTSAELGMAWDARKYAEKMANLYARMVFVMAPCVNAHTTFEERIALLGETVDISELPANATMLQAIACSDGALGGRLLNWVEEVARMPDGDLRKYGVAMIERELYRKLPEWASIDAFWRRDTVTKYIKLRKSIRTLDATRTSVMTDRKMCDRRIRKLQQQEPMTSEAATEIMTKRAFVDTYATQIDAIDEKVSKDAAELLQVLFRIDTLLTLDERCDLFEINVADRLDLEPGASSHAMLGSGRLENSATYRNAGRAAPPVGNALMMAVIASIEASPGGKEILQQGMREFFPEGVLAGEETRVLSDGSLLVNGENTGMKAVPVEHIKEASEQAAAPRVLH